MYILDKLLGPGGKPVSKKEVNVKGSMPPKMVLTILEDLLDSFRKGKVVIQNGTDFVTLRPSDQISLELEAGQKKDKEKIVLELSWHRASETPEMPEKGFRISAEEPPAPPAQEEPAATAEAAKTTTSFTIAPSAPAVSEAGAPMVTDDPKGKKK